MQSKKIPIQFKNQSSEGILFLPGKEKDIGVVLAHGAGGNMHSAFLNFFHRRIAEAGYLSLKFNFFYSQAGRKAPDPQAILIACYEKALESVPANRLVIGGKSMGGRIASYLGSHPQVAGFFFLGYPLHPPGKPDQLRDEHLYSIRKPMFFASGTKDPFARLHLLEKTIKKIGKNATQFLIQDGGHSFEVPKKSGRKQTEILEETADALLQWLASNF